MYKRQSVESRTVFAAAVGVRAEEDDVPIPVAAVFGALFLDLELIEQSIDILFQLRAALEIRIGGEDHGAASVEIGLKLSIDHVADSFITGGVDALLAVALILLPFPSRSTRAVMSRHIWRCELTLRLKRA